MAHPLFIMEQALRQFSSQWYAGFRPSLDIQTKYDGSLVVHSKSFCSNKPSFDWQENSASQFPFSSTPRSKRAKKNARYRRNKKHRMEASKSRTTKEVETQYSVEDGAPNTETKQGDSGFNGNSDTNLIATENSYTPLDNDLAGSGFNDKQNDKPILSKATYVPPNSPEASENKTVTSEVPHPNSNAAFHQCEGCLKEYDRTLEHYPPNNLNCKDCREAQKSLDSEEETQPEHCNVDPVVASPGTGQVYGDHLSQESKDSAEKIFNVILESKNLLPKQQINTIKLSRSDRRKKINCFFCKNLAVKSGKGGLVIENMKDLLDHIYMVEAPPCFECKIFFISHSWFSIKCIQAYANIYRFERSSSPSNGTH